MGSEVCIRDRLGEPEGELGGVRPGPVHDDRPFLYLRSPGIPSTFLLTIAVILLMSFLAVRWVGGPLRRMTPYLDLACLGAAFLLLETRAVTWSALLFGTTWIVNAIVFACDAGMGSSAMGASVLRNKIKKAGVEGVTVVNKAIANLDAGSADLIITQNQLTDRARQRVPDAIHVSVDNFMNSPRYDEVVELVKKQHGQ